MEKKRRRGKERRRGREEEEKEEEGEEIQRYGITWNSKVLYEFPCLDG